MRGCGAWLKRPHYCRKYFTILCITNDMNNRWKVAFIYVNLYLRIDVIVQDGGCTCPGDLAKAFGGGADFVMAGGIFAGHDECGGEVIEKNGKKFKLFYGMSSNTAMMKHAGVADYRWDCNKL